MTSKKNAESVSLRKRLNRFEKDGVKLYLDGHPSNTESIMKNCVKEDTGYMPDYVTDENGTVQEIRYDRIS